MPVVVKNKGSYIIRLDRGDQWPKSFLEICAEKKIVGGFFYGIGGVQDPEVGYYDLSIQKYMIKKFEGIFEIINVSGNIAQLNDKFVIHAHGVFAGPDYAVFGGHFVSGTIGGTLELFVADAESTIKRQADPKTGLNILTNT